MILRGCLPGILGVLLWHAAAYGAATVQRVDLDSGAGILKIGLSRRTEYKAMQLDAREVMVAFRSAELDPSVAGGHAGSGLVEQYSLEKLPDQAVSLMIGTAVDIREVRAEWQQDTAILLLHLFSSEVPADTAIPVKHRKFEKGPLAETFVNAAPADAEESSQASGTGTEPPVEAELPAEPEPAASHLPEASSGILTLSTGGGRTSAAGEGGVSDFMTELGGGPCAAAPGIADALALCRKDRWEEAFTLLGGGLDPAASDACQAERYYLRAFSAYKMNRAGSDRLYLDAVSYFQDALSYYPDAAYAPHAMLALATVYNELQSNAEAKGYFKLILKTYPDHPVAAGALMGLGSLYAKEGRQEQAVSTYREYLAAYPGSARLTEVRLALGMSLYELSEFAESLEMLSRVVDEDPARVYSDPELLVTIGYLNYQLGDLDSAREALVKAVNLYPDSDDVPMLLAKIGDTLKDGGQEDQAKKIYELVMATYPDSDGYAVSAIRYASLLSARVEKEAQYRKVIEGFPGHPMAKLAVIRLAGLQQQAGEYSAGIETLRDMMSGGPKELKNEAEYVMAACFDGYFRQLAEKDDPLTVITAYEKDKTLVNRFENPDIFETVGAAFYQTKFFDQAEELLQKSYTASSPGSRPASLYYRLGVTLQELGKGMQAKEMFLAYFRKLPENEQDPDAYLRMGRLLADEESWERALAFIRSGFQKSESDLQKADFLILQAQVQEAMGKAETVPDLLVKAINLMASSPQATDEQLARAYRRLGENYMKLSAFEKAADAFTMALNFSGRNRPPSLLYLLAEANLKSRHPDAARQVLSEILGTGDDFWARMAEEQLRTMTLEERLENQPPRAAGSSTGENGE